MLSSKPAADAAALSSGFLHVVAGALVDPADHILIAQRPVGKHLAGGWEFPGGKLDPGESRAEGLARELREEIGVEVLHSRPLIRLRHSYADRDVLLDVWLVDRFTGEPRALDHQALRWCHRNELHDADLLAADRAVITALRLPPVIDTPTGSHYRLVPLDDLKSSDACLQGVSCRTPAEVAVAELAGADFVVLQAALSSEELMHVCDEANLPVFAMGVDLDTAWNCGATGIHHGTALNPPA